MLELNIQQDEYIGPLTEKAGIRLDISRPGEMPFPLEKGFSIPPGFETSMGLRKVSMTPEKKEKNDIWNGIETVSREADGHVP